MLSLSRVLFVALMAFSMKDATAITDEQRAKISAKFLKYGAECIVEHPLTDDDLNNFKQKQFPEGENAPCFMACVLKKLGFFDDKGNYSYDDVLEITKKEFEEEDQNNFKELLNNCDKVNKEEVSDGEKGCDRAKLAYNCLIDSAAMYGFDINV